MHTLKQNQELHSESGLGQNGSPQSSQPSTGCGGFASCEEVFQVQGPFLSGAWKTERETAFPTGRQDVAHRLYFIPELRTPHYLI